MKFKIFSALLFCTSACIIYISTTRLFNWYPFGYPVKQGQTWELTQVFNEGTPIEDTDVYVVRIDSTYKGYIIKATCLNCNNGKGTPYTSTGTTMYHFFEPFDYYRIK